MILVRSRTNALKIWIHDSGGNEILSFQRFILQLKTLLEKIIDDSFITGVNTYY
jgi:hypothetical protein